MTGTVCAGQYRQQPSGDAVEFFFYAVPTLIGAIVIAMAVAVINRHLRRREAWASGLTAEARCLRTYTTTSRHGDGHHVSTTLHHVYEFTPPAGRPVRFEEENGPGTIIEGDVVTVYYAADRPEAATVHAPDLAKSTATLIAVLCFFGVMLAFCVFFMVTANDMFDASESFDWDPTDPDVGADQEWP
ncbi:DUF3592 domain-containing protein [Streptomyces sp. NPDC051214]|uniref:DUF3592 domain-containing protein n=1 Tax=Streptomyces sp. NPDC051214 TaxID=3155282 RepID=UPI00342B0C76